MRTDEIVYPYEEEFGLEGKFVTEFIDNNIDVDFLRGESNNFALKVKVDNNSEICNKIYASKNLFMLEEVYQSHKDYVRELLFKKHSNDSVKKEELMALFGSSLLTDNEIELLLYGNYLNPNEWGKRPLAKLTHDIIRLSSK